MKLAVIPDPSPVVIAAMRELAPDARVFAPWALPTRLLVGPSPWRRFVSKRTLDVPHQALLGWTALELALRIWQRGRTDRRYRSMFAMRRLTSELVSRWLGRRQAVTTVLAPSLAAREVFASTSARRILVEDLPGLRQLHRDLERASRAHSECRFLRRFRASAAQVVRQESEWILADNIAVRGRCAMERHQDRAPLSLEITAAARLRGASAPVVQLAGLAAARHGSCEALAMLEAIPEARLRIRAGEGAEPRALLEHPRVSASQPSLEGVSVVISPSWVECYPAELRAAAGRGIPIVATAKSSGHVERDAVDEIRIGDVGGLIDTVASRLSSESDQLGVRGPKCTSGVAKPEALGDALAAGRS